MTEPHATIAPQPGVLDIAPYVGGASHAPGAAKTIKLSSNENPWGASPAATAAYRAAASDLSLYPDPGSASLRAAIAGAHGLNADRILCGNGSDELIALLCLAYAGVGDEVVYSRHGFLLYSISAMANGATPVAAAEENLTASVDNLLAACTDRTRLVFIANPNNPTGTRLNAQELARLADGLPPKAMLVIDAAYAEFVAAEDYDGGVSLVERRDNVVMTRTFSKIHGLAALRLGWLYGPDHVIDALHRVRGPFNVNAAAQAAGVAAMEDADWVATCAARTAELRAKMESELTAMGAPTTKSSGNFVLAEFGTDAATGAAAADAALKAAGVVARRMESYGLAGHLRISVGTEEETALALDVLKRWRAGL